MRFFILLALLTASDFTPLAQAAEVLPNGIRIDEIPASDDRFELIVGYQAGLRSETRGLSGLSSIIGHLLASSVPARSIAVAAYGAGGEVEFLNELDRTALRVSVPAWAKPMILDQIAAFLEQSPANNSELSARVLSAALREAGERDSQFRAKVLDEIRVGLLGSHPYHHRPEGWKSDLEQVTAEDIAQFFAENCGTDRAFILATAPFPGELRERVSALKSRASRRLHESPVRVIRAERSLRFASEESPGAVILASPVPGVFFQGWYSVLMLDRLIRRTVPGKPSTSLIPTLDAYYWSLEMTVPPGQFAEPAEENVMQEINRLQFSRAKTEDLEAARRDATEYLDSAYVRRWFLSHGLEARRAEGIQWVKSFTADDMRATARDLIISNRVVASWSPKTAQRTVEVVSLRDVRETPQPVAAVTVRPLPAVPVAAFPAHTHAQVTHTPPQKLSSGVSLVPSSIAGVFLSGPGSDGPADGTRRDGANGVMWKSIANTDANSVRAFQKYRGDRILVLVPPQSLDRAQTAWTAFRGNTQDTATVNPVGKVANIDLPALLVLKMLLDRKLIEAGWWTDATVRLDATRGAELAIDAPSAIRDEIMSWIKAIAVAPLADADFAWAREAAIHHLNEILPDLQSLVWQRVPDYVIPNLDTISASQVQDVAKLYF